MILENLESLNQAIARLQQRVENFDPRDLEAAMWETTADHWSRGKKRKLISTSTELSDGIVLRHAWKSVAAHPLNFLLRRALVLLPNVYDQCRK